MQRRISETQLVVNVIEPGTSPEVMFNIFRRINTGGMTLNGQEIRHALNPGQVRGYLKALAEIDEFLEATDHSIRPRRMADRECVLRFLAFHIEPWERYAADSLESYLERAMKTINGMAAERLDALAGDFKKAMRAATRIFGNDAFRKRYRPEDGRHQISLALFEAWGVQLARCSAEELERLVARRTEGAGRVHVPAELGRRVREGDLGVHRDAPADTRNGLPPSAIWCRGCSDAAPDQAEELQVLRESGSAVRPSQPAVWSQRDGEEQRDPGLAGVASVV